MTNLLGNRKYNKVFKLGTLVLCLASAACSKKDPTTPENSSGVGGSTDDGAGGGGGEGGAAAVDENERGLGAFGRCAPATKGAKTQLIDDFEGGLREVGDRDGRWVSFDDRSGGTFAWEAIPNEKDDGSQLHLNASDFKEWAGFGIDISASGGTEARCAFDAKDFMGVRFIVRGHGTLRVHAATVATLPVNEGGTCPDGIACYDQPGRYVELTPESQLIEIPFCGMRVEGWGAEPKYWDVADLVNITFEIQTHRQAGPFEMWFDDLELYREEAAETATDCSLHCPLNNVPNPSNINPKTSYLPLSNGLTLSTFEQETTSCGSLTRRYMTYVPPSLEASSDAPVVIALHGLGANAESIIDVQTRGKINALASSEGFIVVHGNAAPGSNSSAEFPNTGGWRQAESDDGEVDDVDYLRRVLADLKDRKLIAGDNDVFLMGLSNGGGMTLKAAAEMSDRLSGIAAFMPYFGSEPPAIPNLSKSPLSHVLIVHSSADPGLPEGYDLMLSKQPARWAKALGLSSTISSEVALADSVDEGADYSGTSPVVLATQRSSVVQKDYTSETSNAAVRELTIMRGGHFLPNAVQDTDSSLIERWGLRNQDVDASQIMWEFFKTRQGK